MCTSETFEIQPGPALPRWAFVFLAHALFFQVGIVCTLQNRSGFLFWFLFKCRVSEVTVKNKMYDNTFINVLKIPVHSTSYIKKKNLSLLYLERHKPTSHLLLVYFPQLFFGSQLINLC